MSIKRILAMPVLPDTTEIVLGAAACIARPAGANIALVGALGGTASVNPSNLISFDVVPPQRTQEIIEAIQAHLTKERDRFDKAFAEAIDRSGLPEQDRPGPDGDASVHREIVEGTTADFIAQHGGTYDIIVLARPHGAAADAEQSALQSALFATGRPVLVAPPEPAETIGERVLIGWNRGGPAARAVHAAKALLLDRARSVVILSVETGAKQGPAADEIAESLAWHGIAAEVRVLDPAYRSIAEVLMTTAQSMNADLIVMGAYSHSRLREMVMGGVTQKILFEAKLPVLMAQ